MPQISEIPEVALKIVFILPTDDLLFTDEEKIILFDKNIVQHTVLLVALMLPLPFSLCNMLDLLIYLFRSYVSVLKRACGHNDSACGDEKEGGSQA